MIFFLVKRPSNECFKKSYFSPNFTQKVGWSSFIKLSILLNPGSLNRVSVIFGCLCDCLKGQTQCFLNYFSLIHIYAIFLFILESCVSWERVVTALSAHTLRNIYYLHIYDRDICSITICTNNYLLTYCVCRRLGLTFYTNKSVFYTEILS